MISILKIEKLSESNLVNTAVFAALWGVTEVYVGTLLHASKLPFRGSIMSLAAILILVGARAVLNYKGSLILLGIVTATFKLFLGMGFNLTPFIAIIIESLIAEIMLNRIGFNGFTSLLTGIIIMFYTLIHGLIMQAIFLGTDIYRIYYDIILQLTNYLGFTQNHVLILLILLPIIYLSIGASVGLFGWSFGKNILILLEENR